MTLQHTPNPDETLEITLADLDDPKHQKAVLEMTEAYSQDAWGGGEPLSSQVRENLIPGLRKHPTTLVFLAFTSGEPVAIATCFLGFSTFAAKPLINIHDMCVLPEMRGRGLGHRMLEAVAEKGRELGCCKLTLEVLGNNHTAMRVYQDVGFRQLEYHEGQGGALFFAKPL
jgi:GNAT superfamily N-acetyltransferase